MHPGATQEAVGQKRPEAAQAAAQASGQDTVGQTVLGANNLNSLRFLLVLSWFC